jgi:hypothetical protein
MTEIYDAKAYTEARHTAYGSVKGADPIDVESRRFIPEMVTVHYEWRTQLDHHGWHWGNIEISGRWIDADGEPTGTGSGRIICGYADAPQWAKDFAGSQFPMSRLVPPDTETVTVKIAPDGIKDGQWRLAALLDDEAKP